MGQKRGGHGEVAITEESHDLDRKLKNFAPLLAKDEEIINRNYKWVKATSRVEGGKSVVPDGGIFINEKNNTAIAFEAKHQGKKGNACERLGNQKDWIEYYLRDKKLSFVVLCTGLGAATDCQMGKTYKVYLWDYKNNVFNNSNTYNHNHYSIYYAKKVFSGVDMMNLMKQILIASDEIENGNEYIVEHFGDIQKE